MAVYTHVSKRELVMALERFAIGILISFDAIAEGIENSNYVVNTTKGRFILTLYEKRVTEDDLPFFIDLLVHLTRNSFNCPMPIYSLNGAVLFEVAGRKAAFFTFLEGRPVSKITASHCVRVGGALARLHIITRNFSGKRPNDLSLANWRQLHDRHHRQIDCHFPRISELIETILADLEQAWPEDLPSGVIHADLFPDNVFFSGQRISGLIDFYFSCTDYLAYDIAICLNAWCFEEGGDFNRAKAAALVEGYNRHRQLEPMELTSLPCLARGAAIRFLLTRLIDWITIEDLPLLIKKDPTEYIDKLRFHDNASSLGEYGLGR